MIWQDPSLNWGSSSFLSLLGFFLSLSLFLPSPWGLPKVQNVQKFFAQEALSHTLLEMQRCCWNGSVHESRNFRKSHLCTLYERGMRRLKCQAHCIAFTYSEPNRRAFVHCTGDDDGLLLIWRQAVFYDNVPTQTLVHKPVTMQLQPGQGNTLKLYLWTEGKGFTWQQIKNKIDYKIIKKQQQQLYLSEMWTALSKWTSAV